MLYSSYNIFDKYLRRKPLESETRRTQLLSCVSNEMSMGLVIFTLTKCSHFLTPTDFTPYITWLEATIWRHHSRQNGVVKVTGMTSKWRHSQQSAIFPIWILSANSWKRRVHRASTVYFLLRNRIADDSQWVIVRIPTRFIAKCLRKCPWRKVNPV